MKYILYALFALVFFGSCVSIPFDTAQGSSWASAGNKTPKGTVRVISVSAEAAGERGSLEKEITGLIPLLFLDEGYLTVSAAETADFSAEVTVREREYIHGWRTKRSLSAELRLWGRDGTQPLPLSAGRALVQGKQSLSSSKTLGAMLRKAVRNAVKGLPAGAPGAHPEQGEP